MMTSLWHSKCPSGVAGTLAVILKISLGSYKVSPAIGILSVYFFVPAGSQNLSG